MLGWQVLWGALFAWLFGPSFTAIRLSMVPVAMLTVVLYHVILRRFGLNRAHAIFGTLTLAFSPLFLALSDTFMSDISGLFSLFLCLYLCQTAIAAKEDSHAALWLVLAGLTNVLSGTVRQISWLGVLVMVPCCAWLLRRRRYVLSSTIATWVVSVLLIKLLIAWFLRHPYSIPETILRDPVSIRALRRLGVAAIRSLLSTLLYLLPVLVAFAAAVWPVRKNRLAGIAAVSSVLGIVYFVLHRADERVYLWLGNIITPHGVMQDMPLLGSGRQVGVYWQALLVAIFVFFLLGSLEAVRAFPRRKPRPPEQQNRRTMALLLLPLLFTYCLLLIPRAAFVVIFDRYVLVIMAIVLIYMLRAHQERVSTRIPAIATASVALIALLGIAATHDLFAINRAEVRLAQELHQAGVPRTQIRGGFDFDSVTQVETTGYLNDPHLINPPGSYHPQPLLTPVFHGSVNCAYPLQPYVPALDFHYVISADPTPCLRPTSFPVQSYRTWLPPAKRQLFVGIPALPAPSGPEPSH